MTTTQANATTTNTRSSPPRPSRLRPTSTAPCRNCRREFSQRSDKHRTLCFDCAMARHREAVQSMKDRAGAPYETWVVKEYRHARAEMIRLGLLTAPDADLLPRSPAIEGGDTVH